MELLSQRSRFSTDRETKGFDNSAGDRWIYPENYPLRDYQFSIVQSALYHNTLVCLPTGLGKTFIAAVVMYNFWRWYPRGKIVFLAPTKPLVAQQIKACHSIMGIESEETIELTGQMDQKKRQVAWSDSSRARVVFATPQVFHNDLEKNIIPTDLIKCIVVDEAHKALGKHSYCESIRLLSEKSKYFRVLGLSATPGGKLDAVQDVIRNLHISRLELRDDASPDITPYVNERKLDIVLVRLGDDLERFKERYIAIMDPHVRVLIDNQVLRGHTGTLSKGRIFFLSKEWQQKENKPNNHAQLSKTLMILMTMYHAYELMIRHGLRAFYNFYQKHEDKFWLSSEHALTQLLEEINYFLGPFPDISSQTEESFPLISEDVKFGHNKFYKLKELLLEHFEAYENREEDTRVIVFVEYRDIVNEVYVLLLQAMPLVRPQKFVGQAGQTKKDQKKALEDFRSNKVNVLISTSVGEEGLDVGEVDLIVCFDISQSSPIRLVQRMGRTGRKRDGHIIVLVTDGKEHQTLRSSMARRDSLNSKVLHSSGIMSALYKESPRMVPKAFKPECRKTSVIAPPKIDGASTNKGKTKEAKKPRKRADTSNKPTGSKNSVPARSQSLMKFFKRTRVDVEVDTDFEEVAIIDSRPSTSETIQLPHCSNRSVKPSNVKLLTSDEAAVEFLTLCTMKKSQDERATVKMRTNPYLPSYYESSEILDFNLELPDLKILDCLKTLEPYVEIVDSNDGDSIVYQENDYFRSTQLLRDYKTENLAGVANGLCDSRFEALLDDSSVDSNETHFSPRETKKNDYPDEERVDWAANVTGFDFEDTMAEWSVETRTSHGKTDWNGKYNFDEIIQSKLQAEQASSRTNGAANRKNGACEFADKNDASNDRVPDDPRQITFGIFEELLDDSETSSERDKADPTRHEVIEKSGAFEDLLNGESETCSEKCDSDATIDGLDRVSAFEDLLNEESTTKSEMNDTDSRRNEATIDSFNDSAAPEAASDLRPNDDFSTAKFPKIRGDEEFEMKINKFASAGTSADTIFTRDESIDVLEGHRFSQISDTQESEKFLTKNSGPTNSTPSNPARGSSSGNPLRRSLDAFERACAKKNSPSDEFVNNERSSRVTLDFVDAEPARSRHDENSSSREDSGKVPAAAEQTESDDDIFASEDIFVDPNFEEEIIKIEKSAENNSSRDRDIVTETPKKIAAPTIEPKVNEGRAASPRKSLALDLDLGDKKSDIFIVDSRKPSSSDSRNNRDKVLQSGEAFEEPEVIEGRPASPRKSFRFDLNLSPRKNEIFIVGSCKSDRADSRNNRDKVLQSGEALEEPEVIEGRPASSRESFRFDHNLSLKKNEILIVGSCKSDRADSRAKEDDSQSVDWKSAGSCFRFRSTSDDEPPCKKPKPSSDETTRSLANPRVTEQDLNLDDCDWDSNDFEAFVGPSTARNVLHSSTEKTERGTIASKVTADSGKREKTIGWLTTQKSKSRLSLSKKLSRNICNSLWSKRTKERGPPGPDSDAENDFIVSRLETTIPEEIGSDCFVKPNPVAATRRLENATIMNRHARSIRAAPLACRRDDLNKLELKDLKTFSAPAKYEKRDVAGQRDVTRNDRKVGGGKPKFASCDLDTRKRKRSWTDARGNKRARIRSAFVDDEAEVSTDFDGSSGTSGSDDDLEDFVSYTQNVSDGVDMHAHYLQTIRSPTRIAGFFVREPKSPRTDLQIYSQPVVDEPNHYVNDSFCVDEHDDVFEESATAGELTRLEELELRLRRKKRKRTSSSDSRTKVKRKVVVPRDETTSSEDETEELRRQIQEESFALKNRRK